MKNTVAVSIACLAIAGCVSSSYKLSIPPVEDKGTAKYHVQQESLAAAAKEEGVYDSLYSTDSDITVMPLQVSWTEQVGERKLDVWSSLFGTLTLGVYPFHTSITTQYDVKVNGPQGRRIGQFEIVKSARGGWFAPLFVSDWDKRADDEELHTYNPGDLVERGIVRKTLELAGDFDYEAYVAKQKKTRIEKLGKSRDEAKLSDVVQSEKDVDIRAAAEQRLKEIAEKTALEKKRREEVKAQVATCEENQEWDSIIALCDKEIPNVDFLDDGELQTIKVKAERDKELNRIAGIKAIIEEKTKEEKWDDIIGICKKELLTVSSSHSGYLEDSDYWVSTRDEAEQALALKIKAELDDLLDMGQWKVVLERCEHEFGDKDRVLRDVIADVKARAEEVRQKAIAEREQKKAEIIERLHKKYVNSSLNESDQVAELWEKFGKAMDTYSTNSIEYLEIRIVVIAKISIPISEGLKRKHDDFKKVLDITGYSVSFVTYDSADQLKSLHVRWNSYFTGTMYATPWAGEGRFSFPEWMAAGDAKIIWDHYSMAAFETASSDLVKQKALLNDCIDQLLMLQKIKDAKK